MATNESENFYRIATLVVDGGTLVLRSLLKGKVHSSGHSSLRAFLQSCRGTINTLKRKRVLHEGQVQALLPGSSDPDPDVENFDVTLLCVILKNMCSLSASELSDVETIRTYRNEKFGHASKTKICTSDFNVYWTDISNALTSLARSITDPAFQPGDLSSFISKVQSGPLDTTTLAKTLADWYGCDFPKVKHDVETLKTQTEQTWIKVENLSSELDHNTANLKTLQIQMEQSQTRMEQAETKLEQSQGNMENLSSELDMNKVNVKTLQTQMEQSQTRMEQAEAKLEQSQGNMENLLSELDVNRADIKILQTKTEQSQTRVEQAEAKLEQSQGNMENLSFKVDINTADIKTLQTKMEQTERTVKNLTSKFSLESTTINGGQHRHQISSERDIAIRGATGDSLEPKLLGTLQNQELKEQYAEPDAVSRTPDPANVVTLYERTPTNKGIGGGTKPEITSEDKDRMQWKLQVPHFDVAVLYTEEDRKEALEFVEHLRTDIDMDDGEPVKVIPYDDEDSLCFEGDSFSNLEVIFAHSTHTFLYLTDNWTDCNTEFRAHSCLLESITNKEKRWSILPVKVNNAKVPFAFRNIKGITYYPGQKQDKWYLKTMKKLIKCYRYKRKRREDEQKKMRSESVTEPQS